MHLYGVPVAITDSKGCFRASEAWRVSMRPSIPRSGTCVPNKAAGAPRRAHHFVYCYEQCRCERNRGAQVRGKSF